MKTCVLATALAAALLTPAAPAYADNICKSWGDLARSIMVIRLRDISMSVLMEDVGTHMMSGDKTELEAMRKVGKALVIAAYERPSWSSENMKQNAIAEFGNEVELSCYNNTKLADQ